METVQKLKLLPSMEEITIKCILITSHSAYPNTSLWESIRKGSFKENEH